ncbi:glyoxalase [Psychroflexus montanilacus]|uniref:glyoxalase n=1 Tax=Psychroflexus montanilacus TaxID=2873598 RepID=UPI001CCEA5B1|nr:glyoxalase [Psychroflexus montanilacus]MBZ9650528.1 glyoxalase [Psychroflexus montanilacus]
MDSRNERLLSIRLEVPNARVDQSTLGLESFQNSTLRPISKFQNELILSIFENYIIRYKNVFHKLGNEEKLRYIENTVKKDSKFKNLIRGIFMGHFTIEEYKFYSENSSEVNKRIINLTKERLQSQLEHFEKYSA